MCASSVVSDYYGRTQPGWFSPSGPAPDAETQRLLREVMLRLDAVDKRLGDIECKDPEKAKFAAAIGLAPTPDVR